MVMKEKITLTGLLGENLEKSISPFIHQCLIDYYALNYLYLTFPISSNELSIALKAIKAFKIKGMNITIPFKELSLKFMDEIDQVVAKIGALNTIVLKDNKLYGYNTDWLGFLKPLQDKLNFSFAGKKLLILGAGGAARAVIYAALNNHCSEISIFNRNYERAEKMKKNFQDLYSGGKIKIFSYSNSDLQREIKDTDLLVNTTPLGSWYYPNINPIPNLIDFPSKTIIYDLIYYPDKTPLLNKAEESGNLFLNGKPMLVYQAVESFYLWTGIKPDQKLITKILDKV
ncbi:MAG: shikimate dehydrogenase [Candidatus Caldatribacteriota bacterium]